MSIFPWYLVRRNQIGSSEFNHFRKKDWLLSLQNFREIQEDYEVVKNRTILELERFYKEAKDPQILNIKRKIFNDKFIDTKNCNTQVTQMINHYIESYNFKKQVETDLRNQFEQRYQHDREVLREVFSNNPKLSRPLPLVNQDMYHKLKKFLQLSCEDHNASIRKIDYQLSRILARATLKTSPFSSFTSVEIKKMNHVNNDLTPAEFYSAELNYFIYQKVLQLLTSQKEVLNQLNYRLAYHEQKGDTIHFVSLFDINRGKIFNNIEREFQFKNNPIIDRLLFEFTKTKSLSYQTIFHILEEYLDKEKAEYFLNDVLIQKGIVFCDLVVDEYGENVWNDFIVKIKEIKHPTRLNEKIEEILTNLNLVLKKYEEAQMEDRFALIKEMNRLIEDLGLILNYKFPKDLLFYEDFIERYSDNDYNPNEELVEEIQSLQKFSLMVNIPILVQYELAESFKKVFGNQRVPVNSLAVRELFLEEIKKFTNWTDVLAPIGSLKSKDSLQLEVLKAEIKTFLLNQKRSQKVVHISRGQIENWYSTVKTMYKTDRTVSSTALWQVGEEGVVLNKLYAGNLRLFTRFFEYIPSIYDDEDFKDYLKKIFPENTVEIREGYGFNANRHQQLIDKRLLLNNSRWTGIEETVSIDDLSFQYNENTRMVEIIDNHTKQPVILESLGSLVDYMLPSSVRILQNSLIPRLDMDYINIWEEENYHSLVVDYIPRIFVEKLMISREKWLLRTSQLTIVPDLYEQARNLIRVFEENNLPLEFFVKKYWGQDSFNFYSAKKTDMKPQYFNLYSPLYIKDFIKTISQQEIIVIEEVYPAIQEGNFNKEYQFEVLLEGKPEITYCALSEAKGMGI